MATAEGGHGRNTLSLSAIYEWSGKKEGRRYSEEPYYSRQIGSTASARSQLVGSGSDGVLAQPYPVSVEEEEA